MRRGAGERRWPLVCFCALVVGVLLLPLGYLVVQATDDGWTQLRPVLLRLRTLDLLAHTVELTAIVAVTCAVFGVGAAWLVERTDLPARRLFAVLAVLPIAVPRFVIGSEWASVFPQVHGLFGAALVMTLALTPLVFLPVAAGLRSADPGMEEIADSLGLSRPAIFVRVTLRQVRPALLGGCLLVALAVLAEYGAFEALRFQTFTTEIFTQFSEGYDTPAACALSLLLVVMGLVLITADAAAAGRRISRVGANVSRVPRRHALGLWKLPALVALVALSLLALGVPVGTIVYWMALHQTSTLPAVSSLASATVHSLLYSVPAAALATLLATPLAWAAVRRRSPTTVVMERAAFFVQGLPGLVVALGLVFFSVRYLFAIYEKWELLVIGYTIIFFPLSLVAVRASLVAAPRDLEGVGRSLGRSSVVVAARVTVPLLAPGLAAGFCLVLLSALTELTATLLLVPIGSDTLSTQYWAFQTGASDSAAAPYAAVMLGLALVPGIVVARWFHRLPGRLAVGG